MAAYIFAKVYYSCSDQYILICALRWLFHACSRISLHIFESDTYKNPGAKARDFNHRTRVNIQQSCLYVTIFFLWKYTSVVVEFPESRRGPLTPITSCRLALKNRKGDLSHCGLDSKHAQENVVVRPYACSSVKTLCMENRMHTWMRDLSFLEASVCACFSPLIYSVPNPTLTVSCHHSHARY